MVLLADDRIVEGYVERLHQLLNDGTVNQLRTFLRSRVVRIAANERTTEYELPPLPGNTSAATRRLAAGAENDGPTGEASRATEVLSPVRSGDPNGHLSCHELPAF